MEKRSNINKSINDEIRETVFKTVGLFLAVYSLLSIIPGSFGIILGTPLYYLFGNLAYVLFAMIILLAIYMIVKKSFIKKVNVRTTIFITLIFIFSMGIVSIKKDTTITNFIALTNSQYKSSIEGNLLVNGGFFGNFIVGALNSIFKTVIVTIIILVLSVLATIVIYSMPFIKKVRLAIKQKNEARALNKAKKEEAKQKKVTEEVKFKVEDDSNEFIDEVIDSTTIHISGDNFKYDQSNEKKSYKKIENILNQFDDEIYGTSYKTRTDKENEVFNEEISLKDYSYNPKAKKEEEVKLTSTSEIEILTKENYERVEVKRDVDELESLKEKISKLSDEQYEALFGSKKEKPITNEEVVFEPFVSSDLKDEKTIEEIKEEEEIESVVVAHTNFDEIKENLYKEDSILEEVVEKTPTEDVDHTNDKFVRTSDSNVFTLNVKEEEPANETDPIKEEVEEIKEVKEEIKIEVKPEVKVKKVDLNTIEYDLPPLYLLKDAVNDDTNSKNEQIAMEKAEILMEKMKELNVQATINSFVVGPSVTRFEIKLAPGIRVNAFTNLQEDFKLALGVNSIRIESPIPGKPSTIGIEVPNDLRAMVSMKEVVATMPNKKTKLYVPVGKDVSGKPLAFPIVDMPHCLISGATNSGKSVCANAIIMSMLLNYRPNEVRFIMVDPKHVEMAPYADIPHLLCPIITESSRAFVALDKLCVEMDRRFTVFSMINVKNIASYNELMESRKEPKMSFIVVVIDEFAELMLGKNSASVEEKIQKLSQLGRACGIHLVLLTQRPDTNVISGTIKNNLPCRMTFRLSSFADSRTVIDVGGAEKLLNRGDMLLLTPDYTGLRRVQGVYVSDEEINNVVQYCKKQVGPQYEDEFLDLRTDEEKKEAEKQIIEAEDKKTPKVDETYLAVKDYVMTQEHVSTNNLQVVFKFNYLKAFNYINQLEAEGIIGPSNGTKPRDVLANKKQEVEEVTIEQEELDDEID